MRATRVKRGVPAKHIALLGALRPLVGAPVPPEGMLDAVAALLATEIGQYCVIDAATPLEDAPARRPKRLAMSHADPRRRVQLSLARTDADLEGSPRHAKLSAPNKHGEPAVELVSEVSEATRRRLLADVTLPDDEVPRSYMAAAVRVDGAAYVIVTLLIATGARRYDAGDLAVLRSVADWLGLGLENALRRRGQLGAARAPERREAEAAPERATGVRTRFIPGKTGG